MKSYKIMICFLNIYMLDLSLVEPPDKVTKALTKMAQIEKECTLILQRLMQIV